MIALRRHCEVSEKQREFLESSAVRRAYIGGRGSGKTWAGCLASLIELGRGRCSGAVVAPTYVMVQDVILPTFRELAGPVVESFNKAALRAEFVNGSSVIFRSADRPDRLRGLNLSFFWLDEAALCDEYVWRVLVATLREGGRGGKAWITTTPRGKSHWIYRLREGKGARHWHFVHASMFDNPFLGEDFKEAIEREYGVGWFGKQEIGGEFVDPEGALFQRRWFKVTDGVPDEFVQVTRGWDLALSVRVKADYTCGVKVGITRDGDVWVLDVIRGKWEWPDARKEIIKTAQRDGVECHIAVEKNAFQLSALQELWREPQLVGYAILPVHRTADKLSVALPFASRAQAGKVFIKRASWTDGFLDELCSFDGSGKLHDDQVDAVVNAAGIQPPSLPSEIDVW